MRGSNLLTHGATGTVTHDRWRAMKHRCYVESGSAYARYGARGIRVCRRWQNNFRSFLSDMGPCPTREHSLDRIDNDKGYSRSNCRWVLKSEQSRNRRCVTSVTWNGTTNNLTEWSRLTGISRRTLTNRFAIGLRPPDLFGPIQHQSARRNCVLVSWGGKTLCLAEWAREIGIGRTTLHARHQKGLQPPELFIPVAA